MKAFFTVLLVIVSLIIIGAVLLMEPKSQGLGSGFGSETNMFDMAGNNRRDALLNRVIVVSSIIFVVSAILVTAL